MSNALCTEFAVSALKGLQPEHERQRIDAGIAFLAKIQGQDGLWPRVNYIKPRFATPYASSLITTAYCVEALPG